MSIDPLTQAHHYLPQFYQRRWTGSDGMLEVFERPREAVLVKRRSPRATGKLPGLYAIPVAPEPDRNVLEDRFWRTIDQWGVDGLASLEAVTPQELSNLERQRWAVFLLSLIFRDPSSVARIDQAAREHYQTGFADFARRYDELRASHEPDSFADFIDAFDQPGLSEFGATILRAFSTNREVRLQLLAMNWQVVTVSDAPVPLLTSDRPVIRYKGLKDDEGLLMLPLGPTSFFVAYNTGPVDMKAAIHASIVHGRFMESMNDYVVQSAHRFAYGSDTSQIATVERYLRRPTDPVLMRW